MEKMPCNGFIRRFSRVQGHIYLGYALLLCMKHLEFMYLRPNLKQAKDEEITLLLLSPSSTGR